VQGIHWIAKKFSFQHPFGMLRHPFSRRFVASWILLILAVSSVLPLDGARDDSRLASWGSSVWSGGSFPSLEPGRPGLPTASRGWSASGEGSGGKDVLDLSAAIFALPVSSWESVRVALTPTSAPRTFPGLGYESPTLRPRPPPHLSAVL